MSKHIKENDLRRAVFLELFYKNEEEYIMDQMTDEEKETITNMNNHIKECPKCKKLHDNIEQEMLEDIKMENEMGCTCCEGCSGCK